MKPLCFNRFLVFLALLRCLAYVNGDVGEAEQLLLFKSSLQTPNRLPDWLKGANPCSFTGVSCRNSTVSSIDLSNIDLSADLELVSSSLLTLPGLESFVAKNCNLTGTVSWGSRS